MRKIIHIDMDAFFAAVEMRDRPSLRHLPMAVGGSSDKRGVLATANYQARSFGVRSAMPTALAIKLCPQLVLIKPDFKKYSEASEQVFEIFQQYTDRIEGLSLDEAYLDVTNSPYCYNSATWMAQEIRQKIFKETQLTASAGIAPNKLIAKLASDHRKPNGQHTVAPPQVGDFIASMPVERIWGIGKVTAARLHQLELRNCQDLQRFSRQEMIQLMGKFGDALYDFCRGIDEREVETEYERKSLSNEETFAEDIADLQAMKMMVIKMVQELQQSLISYQDRHIKNVHVKIKYHDFRQTTIERQLPLAEESFLELLEERWLQDPRPVRLLGVGVKFDEQKKAGFQLPLLTE